MIFAKVKNMSLSDHHLNSGSEHDASIPLNLRKSASATITNTLDIVSETIKSVTPRATPAVSIDTMKCTKPTPESSITEQTIENFQGEPIKKSLSSTSSCLCRICQNNTARERLISPCNCKGSLAYVHKSCLEKWLNLTSRTYCELCLYQFNSIVRRRYGLCQSLRLWIQLPRNRHNLQSDILITCLLTIVTAGLIIVCFFGMQYFILEGRKMGISIGCTRAAVAFFLGFVLMGYWITLYLLIKDQFLPWYRWWKQTLNVRLVLTPNSSMC